MPKRDGVKFLIRITRKFFWHDFHLKSAFPFGLLFRKFVCAEVCDGEKGCRLSKTLWPRDSTSKDSTSTGIIREGWKICGGRKTRLRENQLIWPTNFIKWHIIAVMWHFYVTQVYRGARPRRPLLYKSCHSYLFTTNVTASVPPASLTSKMRLSSGASGKSTEPPRARPGIYGIKNMADY